MNMPDHNSAAEIQRDQEGVDAGPFMAEALDSIVSDLMSGEKVRGLAWTLGDLLDGELDLGEIVAAALITGDFAALKDTVELRLRTQLADHDAVHDRAYELATEGEE